MLQMPYLALCENRAVMPKNHPSSGAPEDWFSNDILNQNELFGITFDFFIDWSQNPYSVTPVIWIKRILSFNYTYNDLLTNIDYVIINEFGQDYINRLTAFASIYDFQVQFLFFRDDSDWSNDNSQLLIVNAEKDVDGNITFNGNHIFISQLRELIRANSGGPIRIGQKGLIYGTSRLECFLSKTDSLYPGDVDLIILDKQNIPRGILEFKKHTLNNPIDSQKLSNYYPMPDGRKYDRLALLKDYLSREGNKIPFFVIYYPTNGEIKQGRLELLQGVAGTLSTRAASNFPLPHNKTLEDYTKVVIKLKNAIAWHYSQ